MEQRVPRLGWLYTEPALVGDELGKHLSDVTLLPSPPLQGKYSKRKGRFKRSDGSTSSDTTSNSFVRQVTGKRAWEMQPVDAVWLCDFLQAPFLIALVNCLEPPHPTPRDLSASTASAPPLTPAPSPCCLPLLPACLPASSHSGTAWPASSWLASGCHPLPLPAVCFHVLPQNL